MKITDIFTFEVRGHWDTPLFPPSDRQAQMLDVYPEFNAQDWAKDRGSGFQEMRALYFEIHTDEGPSGIFGPIEEEQAYLIHKSLRPFLLGRDPLATETLYDQMLRLNRHGRSGLFMTGVSVVDCALWEQMGFTAQKRFFRYGPGDGEAGKEKNIAAVPPQTDLPAGKRPDPTARATRAGIGSGRNEDRNSSGDQILGITLAKARAESMVGGAF